MSLVHSCIRIILVLENCGGFKGLMDEAVTE